MLLKMSKMLYLGHKLLMTLTVKKVVGTFYEIEVKKTSQTEFGIEKVIKKKR